MIDHIWSVLCSRAVIDIESNNVSIQNVIQQIKARTEPSPDAGIPIQADMISLWVRSDVDTPAQGWMRLRLRYPSARVDDLAEMTIDLMERESFRSRIHLGGVPAREAGRHYYLVEFRQQQEDEWQQVAAVPLRLIFAPPDSEDR